MFWKCNWVSKCCQPPVYDLNNTGIEEFEDLINYSWCDDPPVPAEMLVRYLAGSRRRELLSPVSIEELIRMSYAPSIKAANKYTGNEYLYFDRMHCASEELKQLRKLVAVKDQLKAVDYANMQVYETAVFEICRRNDAELLRIYLDEFNGYYPVEIYDAVFDYYIYMYLPEWDLLRQFNEQNGCSSGNYPGSRNEENKYISPEVQQNLLDILIQQAEKCQVPLPEVLKILFQHDISSCRDIFPIKEQCIHPETKSASLNIFDTGYIEHILLYYDNMALSADYCIEPYDFNDLLTDSCCAVPVTCTCGEPGCAGISAVSESWVMGNKLRLYIPVKNEVYYFNIEDRIALQKKLLHLLRHIIRNVRKHAFWRKKNGFDKQWEMDEAILPYLTSLSGWQKLCRKISKILKNGEYEKTTS